MSELDREAILGERLEAQSAVQERQELRRMVEQKEKKERMAEDTPNYSDDDGGIRTGRDRKTTGATKDKERALKNLKKGREKKQAKMVNYFPFSILQKLIGLIGSRLSISKVETKK